MSFILILQIRKESLYKTIKTNKNIKEPGKIKEAGLRGLSKITGLNVFMYLQMLAY